MYLESGKPVINVLKLCSMINHIIIFKYLNILSPN